LSPPSKIAGRAIAMFFLFAFLFGAGQFHRVSSSVLTPVLEQELLLSADVLGLIAGIYFLASATFQLPLGMLLDSFGPQRVAPIAAVVAAFGTYLYAVGDSSLSLIIARFLMGMGYGGMAVTTFVVYSRWIPPAKFATFASWTIAAGNIGGIAATAPLALSIENWGRVETFYGILVFAIFLAIATFLILRDSPPGYVAQGERPKGLGEAVKGYVTVLQHKQMRYLLVMMAVTFGPGMVILGLWGGSYLTDVFGLDVVSRGYVLLALAVANPVGLLIIGPMDRVFNSRRKVVIMGGSALALSFLTLAVFGRVNVWLSIGLMIMVMIAQGYYVTLQTHCRAFFPDHIVGRANSLMNFCGVLGVFMMQWGTGFLVDFFPSDVGIADPVAYQAVFLLVGILTTMGVWYYSRCDDSPVFEPAAN
jgi:MFS family permease